MISYLSHSRKPRGPKSLK
uniref:Uncharacterized protein n=1 Tax=Rhizophora mucronata TaxID=61149 RepID=A0A2P2NP44_RHIMU